MNETFTFKRFFEANAYRFVTSVIGLILIAFAWFAGFQLFQYTTTKDVQALQSTQSVQGEVIRELVIDGAVIKTNQDSFGKKIDEIGQDVKDIKQYLLEEKNNK